MARLDIVPATVINGFPTLPLAADSADFVFSNPAVAADGISYTSSGREVLLVQNTSGGALTFTVASSPLNGRTGDITAYSLGAGEFAAIMVSGAGWEQASRKVFAVGSTTGIKFAVLRLPHVD